MMPRLAVSCLVLLSSLYASAAVRAEPSDNRLISPHTANHHGMERAWFTQLRLDPGAGVVDLRLHINSTSAQTVFRVISERGPVYSFSNRDLDPFGEQLGEEGAGDAAADKARLLQLEGIDSRIEQAVVPDIALYVTTGSGLVHAIDAETGRILWTTGVGTMRYPTSAPTATDNRVAVVNGQTLYVLDAANGAVLEERRVVGGPGAGPAILGNEIYVPLLSGQLKGYEIGPDARPWLRGYHSLGRVEHQPIVAGQYLVWVNTEGGITVVTAGKHGVRNRFNLNQPIAGPIVFIPPQRIVAATQKGGVYCFDLESNQLVWRYASGYETREPALVVEDVLYLVTRDFGMFAISATTGESLWPQAYRPARKFVAATKDHVYCTSDLGYLVTLDAESGHPIGQVPMNLTDRAFSNIQTDRVYIATRGGTLQCLHEMGADLPTLHLVETPEAEGQEEEKKAESTVEEPATAEGLGAAPASETEGVPSGEETTDTTPDDGAAPGISDNPFE